MSEDTYFQEVRDVPEAAHLVSCAGVDIGEEVTLAEGKGKKRSLRIEAVSGEPIPHWYWGPLLFDLEGMESKKTLLVLREHMRDRVAGKIPKPLPQGKKLIAENGELTDKTRDGRELFGLLEDEYPFEASIRAFMLRVEEVAEGAKATVNGGTVQGPITIARAWKLREVSICALGYDAGTRTVMNSEGSKTSVTIFRTREEKKIMGDQKTKKIEFEITPEQLEKAKVTAVEEARDSILAEGAKAEKNRVLAILAEAPTIELAKKLVLEDADETTTYKTLLRAEKEANEQHRRDMAASAPEGPKPTDGDTRDPDPDKKPKTIEQKWAALTEAERESDFMGDIKVYESYLNSLEPGAFNEVSKASAQA